MIKNFLINASLKGASGAAIVKFAMAFFERLAGEVAKEHREMRDNKRPAAESKVASA